MSKPLRTFVGVALPDDTQKALVDVSRELGQAGGKMRWTKRENLHVTLKFLGDTPQEEVAEVCRLLGEATTDMAPFRIEVKGLGCFPTPNRPRIIWAGVGEGTAELERLNERLETRLREAGYPGEHRRYVPHVTLGRFLRRGLTGLGPLIEERREEVYGEFVAKGITYYLSELDRGGPAYAVLARIPLGM